MDHTLLAATPSDAYLNRHACASRLLAEYEKRFPSRDRLSGLTGDREWHSGKLEVTLPSDTPLPELGRIASRLCEYALFVYYSETSNVAGGHHYFIKGKSVGQDETDEETKQTFRTMTETGMGMIIPGPIERLFLDPPIASTSSISVR